jgi:hypothetical protein
VGCTSSDNNAKWSLADSARNTASTACVLRTSTSLMRLVYETRRIDETAALRSILFSFAAKLLEPVQHELRLAHRPGLPQGARRADDASCFN